MRRWLPHPWMSAVLAVVWLLLANSASPTNLIGGVLLGVLIPLFTHRFWPERPHPRRPGVIARYVLRLVTDIVRANLNVARRVLGPNAHLKPAFIAVPLELQNDLAITILASTISLTPGTVSAELSADRRTLLVHCLDVEDTDALVREIKQRYEQPLKEVFP